MPKHFGRQKKVFSLFEIIAEKFIIILGRKRCYQSLTDGG